MVGEDASLLGLVPDPAHGALGDIARLGDAQVNALGGVERQAVAQVVDQLPLERLGEQHPRVTEQERGTLRELLGQRPGAREKIRAREKLAHQPELQRPPSVDGLPRQQEVTPAIPAEQQRIDDVHAVARHHPVREVSRILKLHVIGGEHDVAQERDLRVPPGRAVDGADHRHLDVEQAHQQMLALPVDAIPLGRRAPHAGAAGRAGAGVGIAGAGEDDDLVVRVAAHVAEGLGKLAVRQEPPLQRPAVRVKRHLEDAVAPLHADGLIFRRVVVKTRHRIRPPGGWRGPIDYTFVSCLDRVKSATLRCGASQKCAPNGVRRRFWSPSSLGCPRSRHRTLRAGR